MAFKGRAKLLALGDQHGDVVALLVRTELANLFDQGSQQALRRQIPIPPQRFYQAGFAEFFAFRVEGFGDAVGVEREGVAGL